MSKIVSEKEEGGIDYTYCPYCGWQNYPKIDKGTEGSLSGQWECSKCNHQWVLWVEKDFPTKQSLQNRLFGGISLKIRKEELVKKIQELSMGKGD